jgi:ELWxxDGT repeat protein
VLVKDIRAGDYPSYPGLLTAVGDTVFFIARDGVHGRELWHSDGTKAGTALVEDIDPNGSANPRELTESGGDLLFRADDGLHGDELWRSDGTEPGTNLVIDINKGGAFYVDDRARYNAENGTLRVYTFFEGSGTVSVAPAGEGGIKSFERDISGSDTVRVYLFLELTRAAKRTLRRTGQVEVGAKFTFESCGGADRSITRHYTVKR